MYAGWYLPSVLCIAIIYKSIVYVVEYIYSVLYIVWSVAQYNECIEYNMQYVQHVV